MDPTVDNTAPEDDAADTRAYRSEAYVRTGEIPGLEDLFASAARSAGVPVGDRSATDERHESADDDDASAAAPPMAKARGGADHADDGGARRPSFRRRHPKLTVVGILVVIAMIPLGGTYARAMTKEGNESAMARTAGWARDMHLGFLVDWAEQRMYSEDQFAKGGAPDPEVFKPVETTSAPATTAGGGQGTAAPSTAPQIPHTNPPSRVPSPVTPPAEGEGEWAPAGQLINGLPGVYTTKVRPNAEHSSLTVFLAWVDPKLTNIELMPGTDLPGGDWSLPHFITPELCPKAIMATNGMFRMDQARGGYWAEGKEPFKLHDGAASLVFLKDGRVDVAQWGRDYTAADFDKIKAVRQNLELMVDDGKPSPDLNSDKDWGALLKNVYFVWRSGYGVTADGALLYAGGPALTPADLARTLQGAGAVRVMEGDINPEWVTANLFSVDPATGQCKGTKGLEGSEDKGGMRQPANRYLSTDKRDFVAVFAK